MPHSTSNFLFGISSFTTTREEMEYISQNHSTAFPFSSLPVLRVNQNWVLWSGLTKASKTSATGLRISIPAGGSAADGRWLPSFRPVSKKFGGVAPLAAA